MRRNKQREQKEVFLMIIITKIVDKTMIVIMEDKKVSINKSYITMKYICYIAFDNTSTQCFVIIVSEINIHKIIHFSSNYIL